jgi:hypothetical protein
MPTQSNDEDANGAEDEDMLSLYEAPPIIGLSFLPIDVDEEEEVPDTPGQTHMPTLPPLSDPRRSPIRHGEAKKPGTKYDDSQSTLSDDKTAGT